MKKYHNPAFLLSPLFFALSTGTTHQPTKTSYTQNYPYPCNQRSLAWIVLLFTSLLPQLVNAQLADSTQTDSVATVLQDSLPPDSVLRQQIDYLTRVREILLAENEQLHQDQARLTATARRRLTMDMYVDSFRSYRFYACALDPQKVSVQLHNKRKPKGTHTFASIAAEAEASGKSLMFAMNAGMFEPNHLAKGLLVIEGKTRHKIDTATKGYGNFYMQPNGIFALDTSGTAYVVTTQAYDTLTDSVKIQFATQSGPMLLVDGEINSHFNDGSPNRYIRNAVGVTPDNELVFAISERPVTFFELTSFMVRQGCVNALYLDGAISQAYFADLKVGSIEAGNRLGPIISIVR
ncbi:MAG: phosphodiester glycosidase family protein [Bacteroidota bacterium]